MYPDERSNIDENFEELENDLINLDAQYQALSTSNMVNNKEIRFVSMTASFGNWQKTYGFQVYPVMLSKFGVLPDAAQLEAIKSRILQDGVRYIVYEPNMTPDMVDLFNRLQEELSLTRVELNNLSSLTAADEASGRDYLSLMYENLSVLETMKTGISASPNE
jgi:ABC-type Zn uptake system ZnuABC Zn-binding protein ZnuA